VRSVKDFPADKAGLKPGDEITQIGDVLLSDFKDDASQLMKGAKNTKSTSNISVRKTNTAQIVLDEVEIKSVVFFSKIDEKTGYIVLAHLIKASYETKQALEELKKTRC
jgi:carboxyl-terminal processing protease